MKNTNKITIKEYPKNFIKKFSILKYETGEAGSERKLIVKNIGDNDIGKYKCKSNNSQISFELRSGVKKNVIQGLFVKFTEKFYI